MLLLHMMKINLHSIVLLIGPSGSGKSTLAAQRFKQHEIISSDDVRAELCGDFRLQIRNDDVFDELHRRTQLRIAMGQRVVVDATNLKAKDRRFFVELSQRMNVPLYYIVINRSVNEKLANGGWRLEVGGLIEKHENVFRSNLQDILKGDGVATVLQGDCDFEVVERLSLDEVVSQGKFAKLMVVGDVHGNIVEAQSAAMIADAADAFTLYLGDIVDYGDHNLESFNLVYERVMQGKALMVWGNHERKLGMWIKGDFGRSYRGIITAGMQRTVDELTQLPDAAVFKAAWNAMDSMSRQHYVIGDKLFTHAAATPGLWLNNSHRPHGEHGQLAYFGQVDADKPMREDGYPNRVYGWIDQIPTGKTVVVGHDIRSKDEPMVVENAIGGAAIFLDTGSSKGGKLSHMIFKL